jgi:Methyltransferase domain
MRKSRKPLESLALGGARRKQDARDFLLQEMPRQSVCAEIGVYQGDFSARIIRIVTPKLLHLIDPWKYEGAAAYRQSLYGGDKGVSQVNMDSVFDGVVKRFQVQITAGTVRVHRAASVDASAAFCKGYFDWIYVDGNHQYKFVKADLESYFPKVRKRGYMAGDDYGEGGWWQGGVKRAVDEFVAKSLVEVILIKNGQFCLRKK